MQRVKFFLFVLLCACAFAESPSEGIIAPSGSVFNEQRLLGVLPNYQTVMDPNAGVAPLTVKQKWTLLLKQGLDPFNVASAAVGSGFSQMSDEAPRYGHGRAALGMRFGAALGDSLGQSLFSVGVLASVLHQDPRYFRKGPQSGILARAVYSISRIAVTRQDSGAAAFNASGLFGMTLGIAASNLYYPRESVHGSVVAWRLLTSLSGGVIGNLMSEFLPDIQRKIFHHKRP